MIGEGGGGFAEGLGASCSPVAVGWHGRDEALAVDKEEFQGTDQMPMHSFPSTCSVSLVVVLVPRVGFGVFGF